MAYRIVWTKTFDTSFKKLDKNLQQRIAEKIEFLAQNSHLAEKVAHTPSDLEGLSKFRVGNWRVLFWLDSEKDLLILYKTDHRSKIYKNL